MRRLQLRRRVRSRGETPGAWRRTVRDILRQPHIRSFQDLASVAYDDAVDDDKFAERLKAWAGQHTPRVSVMSVTGLVNAHGLEELSLTDRDDVVNKEMHSMR